MMKKICVVAAAVAVLAGALTAIASTDAATTTAAPAAATTTATAEVEKCFGVAKAGQKGDGNENGAVFVNVAKGECEKQGGSLKAPAEAGKKN